METTPVRRREFLGASLGLSLAGAAGALAAGPSAGNDETPPASDPAKTGGKAVAGAAAGRWEDNEVIQGGSEARRGGEGCRYRWSPDP